MASPDPRIKAYQEANKAWASRPEYESPITFGPMQARGKARVDGTVIICMYVLLFSLIAFWVLFLGWFVCFWEGTWVCERWMLERWGQRGRRNLGESEDGRGKTYMTVS